MKRQRILIWGAGGQGLATLDIVLSLPQLELVGLLDSDPKLHNRSVFGHPVLGGPSIIRRLRQEELVEGIIIAIGDNVTRVRLARYVRSFGLATPNCIHPSVQVSKLSQVGQGLFIASNAIIGPHVDVADDVLINAGAIVSHRCRLEEGANLGPGAKLAGSVVVERLAFVGIGASVIQNCRVGHNSTVGGGAVVVRDIPPNSVAVGVPARVIRHVEHPLDDSAEFDPDSATSGAAVSLEPGRRRVF